MSIRLFFSLTLLLAVAACADPVIDATSDDAFSRSLHQVKSTLNEEAQAQFEDTIKMLAFAEFGGSLFGDTSPHMLEAKIRTELHGKSAEDVLELGEALKERRELAKIAMWKEKLVTFKQDLKKLAQRTGDAELSGWDKQEFIYLNDQIKQLTEKLSQVEE